jgi:hypothetical protein
MRSISIAAGVVALLAFASAASAATPTTHDIGGPVRSGKMCWVQTDGNGVAGYWKKCEPAKKAMKKSAKKAAKK